MPCTDINKIIRSAYGEQTEYQALSAEALQSWHEWNEELRRGETVPEGLTPRDRVFINNGALQLTDKDTLPPFEVATIRNMEASGFPDTQLVTTNPQHVTIAEQKGMARAMDPFLRKKRGKSYLGVLDTTGGIAIADKACRFALHKANSLGVRFVLGASVGQVASFLHNNDSTLTGVKTLDGKTHPASVAIVACGGWTPSLIPQLDGVCEATGGSVTLLKLPPALYDRFAPENFPSWMYKVRDGAQGGVYGFPRDERGYLKIGYRGTKYTNPQVQSDGQERSVPVTRWTKPQSTTRIPAQAATVIRDFIDEFLPELAEHGVKIDITRMCWYNDSFDNHFVVDWVPGHTGVMVATAGSGHAFKYLPNIGKWVVDVLEGIGLDRPVVKSWRWRKVADETKPTNVLMEGSKGDRALCNVRICSDAEMSLSSSRTKL